MEQIGNKKISPLVWKAFLRLLPVQIFEIMVFSINSFVDSIVTSHFLGTDGVAAIGFFIPVATVIGITDVLIFGTQILCGRHIGAGEGDKVVSLFSTGVVFLGALSLGITAICLIFREPLAVLLGAEGNIVGLVSEYITGYAPGIIGQVLMGMFMVFLPYNNDIKRCYLGIGVLIVSNTVMDILLVGLWNIGIFGMGIATSCSYLLSCAVMLPGCISRKKAVYFRWKGLCFGSLSEAVRFGLPSLMMVIGCTARGYVMNLALMSNIGSAAVAAMTVQGIVCAIVGAIPMGCANAFLTMGSIYYGEEDRHSLTDLLRFSLRFGTVLSAFVTAMLMLFSGLIASIFFAPSDEAWGGTRQMLLLFPSFLIINTVISLLLKTYQLQKRTKLVNVLSVAEPLLMALFSLTMIGVIGSDAVWLSFPFSELICIIVISFSVMTHSGKLLPSLPEWMKLSNDFGASGDECLEFSVQSMEEVIKVSSTVIDFCHERQIDERKSMFAGLSVEEMVGNVVEHGFLPGEKHNVNVRLAVKERLMICIRDDCRAFDPKSRLEQFNPEDVTKNIGIRMIAGLAEEMNYQCTAGINTLLIRV
ncbi:MAG: ATP-binding protein [Ruminiclostridium sp.]|nr:ATP-binding protein [Ruminiclostridium sp.]